MLKMEKWITLCDPTLLISADEYDEICPSISDKNYILLYFFGDIDIDMQNELHRVAEQRKLKIISFGRVRPWCDKCIDSDPTFFLAYFKNAQYIVTNTFHGTIFSVLYKKRFSAFVDTKIKVKDFLCSIGLDGHVAISATDIIGLYDNCEVLSETVQGNLNKIIGDSRKYLQDCLGDK